MTLLAELRSAGFKFRAKGGKVLVSPADKLTEEQRQAIKEDKPALLAQLLEEAADPFAWMTDQGWRDFRAWAEEWNDWERLHPRLTSSGKPSKKRKRKKPIDALAVVRLVELPPPVWNAGMKKRAIAELLEEEEKNTQSNGSGG